MNTKSENSSLPEFKKFVNMVSSAYKADPGGRLSADHAIAAFELAEALRTDVRIGPSTEGLAWTIAVACDHPDRPLAVHIFRAITPLSVTLRAEIAAINEAIEATSPEDSDGGGGDHE